jgi:hypothetical protein
MVCRECGVDVAEHQKFCHECGAALSAHLAPPTVVDADLPTEPVAATTDTAIDADLPTEPVAATTDATIDADLPTEPVAATTDTPATFDEPPVTQPVEVPITEPVAAWTAQPPSSAPAEPAVVTTTAEMPAAIFDGVGDLEEYPLPREPFRIRVELILALFVAVAVVMSVVADVVDIRTTRPAAGITTGATSLADLGSSLAPAGLAGAGLLVLGALLACFGLRWGAGLAGGAALALIGWATLTIGLAEVPIAVAEAITRTSSEQFTLRVTRDVGWWLAAGIGVVALVVFLTSLRSIGSGGHRPLNPIIGAVTAVATVVLACGPLVPVGTSSFADNFSTAAPGEPVAYVVGRLVQVGLIALAGVAGMLTVRSYGLGLAAGGVGVATVLWSFSIGSVGDRPVGIAVRNPGATDTVPHAVTTVGMTVTLAMLVLAAAFAIVRLRPRAAR